MMIRRIAFVSGLVILNAFGFATVARAGEGGIAGSAAFTVNNSLVTGVAVSAAVGKENASAAAFNYNAAGVGNALQNSAWALGSAGIQAFQTVGNPTGFDVTPVADAGKTVGQINTFSAGTVTVQLGTGTGNAVVKSPTP
ncbi:hypothetical protein IQ269_16225 [Tychonema sp. LEGE 07199]|nr:hypothetical protein [Tychonema sp. LEGE 07199]MBE9130309.1 hypothetical protein [Tychonema sp. LEGE 07196]